MRMLNSFITGSRVYGKPTDQSDIDLVVLMSNDDCNVIWSSVEDWHTPRFGKLNLIVLNKDSIRDVEQYYTWKRGTEELIKMKPVTRDFAVEYFQKKNIRTYDRKSE